MLRRVFTLERHRNDAGVVDVGVVVVPILGTPNRRDAGLGGARPNRRRRRGLDVRRARCWRARSAPPVCSPADSTARARQAQCPKSVRRTAGSTSRRRERPEVCGLISSRSRDRDARARNRVRRTPSRCSPSREDRAEPVLAVEAVGRERDRTIDRAAADERRDERFGARATVSAARKSCPSSEVVAARM